MSLRVAAEALDLLANRRRDDGLAALSLFVHQDKFISSTKPETWLFGSNRCGKTEALCITVAAMARYGVLDPRLAKPGETARKRVWVISLTSEMSRTNVQAKLFQNGARIDPRPPIIPDSEILSWNITTQTLRLKNGSIINFKSCESGRDAFMGADVDLLAFDEVPDAAVYEECRIRIGAGRRLITRGAATILPPAGQRGGVSWMFKAKAQPWLGRGVNTDERNEHPDSKDLDIFTAGLRDNPTILAEDIAVVESIFAPGTPEHRIRVMGELLPSIAGSLAYTTFVRSYHTLAVLSRKNIIPHLPLCLSVDFNPENGVWLIGQRVGRVFRILDEITLERSDIASLAYEFRSRVPAHQAELWIYGDATGRRRGDQTATSSFHLLHQYLSGYPVPIRFKLPDMNPLQRDRVDAVNLQLAPPTGERLVEISTQCERLADDLESAKWLRNGKLDKRTEDLNAADCLGYWIHYEVPTHRGVSLHTGPRSIKTPSYKSSSSGVFPATRQTAVSRRRIGRMIKAAIPGERAGLH